MTTEAGQAAGHLDESTVLRVLEMVQGYGKDEAAQERQCQVEGFGNLAGMHNYRSMAAGHIADRLVAMYRASLGLEEA